MSSGRFESSGMTFVRSEVQRWSVQTMVTWLAISEALSCRLLGESFRKNQLALAVPAAGNLPSR